MVKRLNSDFEFMNKNPDIARNFHSENFTQNIRNHLIKSKNTDFPYFEDQTLILEKKLIDENLFVQIDIATQKFLKMSGRTCVKKEVSDEIYCLFRNIQSYDEFVKAIFATKRHYKSEFRFPHFVWIENAKISAKKSQFLNRCLTKFLLPTEICHNSDLFVKYRQLEEKEIKAELIIGLNLWYDFVIDVIDLCYDVNSQVYK